MSLLFLILVSSLGTCVALMPMLRAGALRVGLVDWPDGRRKMHGGPVPMAGGLALFVAVALPLVLALLLPHSLQTPLWEQSKTLLGLLLAAVIICVLGLADDVRGVRGRHKLLGQLVAVAVVMSFGVMVERIRLFDWNLELGLLAVPFTAFWLLGAINSLNLLDGMDGLLGCIGLIISLAMAVLAALGGQWAAACLAVALAGALSGFLAYNLPPASVFLGDSGSMLIGLVVGVLAIQSSLKGAATIALAAPVAVLTIPILDTAAAILRRKLTGRSIYTTDRGHLHHCLLRRGFSTGRVLLWVSCFCLLTVVGALASLALHNELFAILTACAVAGILIVTRWFGYAEYLLVKDCVRTTAESFWHPRTNGTAHQTEVRLQGSADWKELWQALLASARDLNLKQVRLVVNAPRLHEGYHARWDCLDDADDQAGLWRAEIPLMAGGQTVGRLEITGVWEHDTVAARVAALGRILKEFENALAVLAGGPWPPEPVPSAKSQPSASAHLADTFS